MKISEIMTKGPSTVRKETSLDEALELLDERAVRHLPVVERGEIVGILSDRDLLAATGWLPRRVHACRGPGGAERVPARIKDIMQRNVVTVRPDDEVLAALIQCVERRIGSLPVVEGRTLVGLVTEHDLLRAYLASTPPAREASRAVDCMTANPTEIGVETTLDVAADMCRANGIRHLPVVEAGQLLGILSDRDLRRARGVGRRGDMPVDEILEASPITIERETTLEEAARTMLERKISALPVLDEEELVGILTLTDLLDHYLDGFVAPKPER